MRKYCVIVAFICWTRSHTYTHTHNCFVLQLKVLINVVFLLSSRLLSHRGLRAPASCPGWRWCAAAPGASGGPWPACWPRGGAGWPWSAGERRPPGPPWRPCAEVRSLRQCNFIHTNICGRCTSIQSTSPRVSAVDHVALGCDVSKEHEVQRSFETIQKTCGDVSYLVNAAGVNRWAPLPPLLSGMLVALSFSNALSCSLLFVCLFVFSGTLCCWGPKRTTWCPCCTPTCWAACWPAGRRCAVCCAPRGPPSLT